VRILFVTNEVYPLAKTGGLADVSRALPEALAICGHEVTVFTPYHRKQNGAMDTATDTGCEFRLPYMSLNLNVRIFDAPISRSVKYYLLKCDELFDRSFIYANDQGDYQDNAARFSFFCRAALELARRLPGGLPDVVHCNDWHTALTPAYFRAAAIQVRTVLTIHNLAFQGSFPGEFFSLTGLPDDYFSPRGVEFYGRLNFLKGGILLSDAVTTVSPTYAKEIQTQELGCGLDAVLRENSHKLTGILNGIDDTTWHPGCDPYIPRRYSARSLPGKAVCRRALLKKHEWAEDAPEMLIGMISRLTTQKGFDLLKSAWPKIKKMPVRFIILGKGDTEIEEWLKKTAIQEPEKIRTHITHSEEMAHMIEAGCDAFLMPSRFEPCGLNQMYSQKYGTLPIVHATGGLKDTVIDANANPQNGTGFVFDTYDPQGLIGAINNALKFFAEPKEWKKIVLNAMSKDFSWNTAAAAYEKIYAAT
jgi:starch synthase